jgi:sugar phosphate isomerase/epimerase
MVGPGVALQMFSLRDEAKADYVGTLRLVAAAGYTAIEAAFGFGGLGPAELRRVLDELGITLAASHVGSGRLRTELDAEIDLNLALGNRDLVCAELPIEDRVDEASFHRWAGTLNDIGRRCRARGARLSYHSHAFEFRRFGERRGIEILLGETDPAYLSWEPDVYWITYAGEDPAGWIGRYAQRCRLVHLKDMTNEPLPADPIGTNATDLKAYLAAAVGDGRIDFAPAIAAATSAEWLIVEQDFSPQRPMLESLALSRRALAGWAALT